VNADGVSKLNLWGGIFFLSRAAKSFFSASNLTKNDQEKIILQQSCRLSDFLERIRTCVEKETQAYLLSFFQRQTQ